MKKAPSGRKKASPAADAALFPALEVVRLLADPQVPLQDALARHAALAGPPVRRHQVLDEGLLKLVDAQAHARACELLAHLLDRPDFLDGKLHDLGRIAGAVVRAGRQDLRERLVARLSGHGQARWNEDCDSSNYANNIGAHAVQVMQGREWITAIELFELALSIEAPRPPRERLELYANALYPLQQDNSGLPVDAGRNRRFLARCLPFGPHHPGIYFNAACLYVEMAEFDEAVKMVKLAVRRGYDGLAEMKSQLDTQPLFKQFRQFPAYQALRFHPGG